MSQRHEAREWAVQYLFQCDFNREEREVGLRDFWAEHPASDKARAFAEKLIRGVLEHRAEVDERLQTHARHWDVKRMGALDRNVMRLAIYEMLFRPDIPPVVSIDEAVEIAKTFSSRESGRFVNGILDQVARHMDRPAREAVSEEPST